MNKPAAFVGAAIIAGFILYEVVMQPLGIRQNNPGNLRPEDDDPLDDFIGVSGAQNGFLTFYSAFYGLRAAARVLRSYATKHGIWNIAGVAERWAPKSENDTNEYAETVARVSGFGVTAPIDLTDPDTNAAVLAGIVVAENGYKFIRIQWFTRDEILRAVNNGLGLS